jgi:uncharacterized protein
MDQRLTLITLGVADLPRATAFYRDALGWTPSASSSDEITFFQLNSFVLALWPRQLLAEDARVLDRGGWGGFTLAQNVRSSDEVDRVFEGAVAAGATALKRPEATEWGGYSGYVADPDGHAWEIAHNPYWELAEDGSLTLGS